MTITSITIGGVEKISKIQMEGFAINDETAGRIGTCGFTISDTHAAIAAIAKAEVIVYVGATKIFGGNIGTVEPRWINAVESQAQIVCQDYNALLGTVTVPLETYSAQTDEAILDDLFSTYLSAVSTAAVVQVKASVTATFTNQTLRQCVETLADLTGAEWYVDANKALQWYDPAAQTSTRSLVEQDENLLLHSDALDESGSWIVTRSSVTANDETHPVGGAVADKLVENTDNNTHSIQQSFEANDDQWITISISAKADERSVFDLYIGLKDLSAYPRARFDLSAGTITYTASGYTSSITSEGSGWYRCSLAGNVLHGANQTRISMVLVSGGDQSYQGDGSSGLHFCRAQANRGTVPGEYSATSTRSKFPFLQSPFTYSRDWQNLCNSVTVVGATTALEGDPPYTAVSGAYEPGSYAVIDDSWPMTDPYVTHGAYAYLQIAAEYSDPNYNYQLGYLRFDTSAIPDNATISRAVLRLYPSSASNASHFELGVEYFAVTSGAPALNQWTQTPSNSAYGYILGSNITVGSWTEFELTSPNTNVSKTGYTGFRLHPKLTTPSTSPCLLLFDRIGTTAPKLLVEWSISSTISETRTDATSIGIYGTFKRTIYDESITTAAQAQLRGDVELARYAYPEEFGNIVWRRDGISRGDVVRIVSAIHGVDDDYHLARVTTRLDSGVMTYSGQYGRHQPDLIHLLRKQAELS